MEICIEVADRNIPYWQTYTFRKKFEDYEKAQERKVDIEEETNENIKNMKIQDLLKKKKLYEAFQWLYSISNRTGREHYGLGRDVTRGYTRHGTIELRAWRTTLDYRSVCARVKLGWYFIKWLITTMELDDINHIDWEEESIWTNMNPEIKNAYMYLAFHYDNKHYVGLSETELIAKLDTTKLVAKAIKQRSKMFKKQREEGNPEKEAKRIFETI